MYVTDAIILKKEPVGEADVLVTALTDRFVRIRLVAQGARKVGAKLKGHLEPLSLSRFSFVVGRKNYRLIGAELQDFFPIIKNEPERFRVATEIASVLDSVLFEDVAEKNGNFFAIAHEALKFINEPLNSIKDCELAFLWFRTQFLRESGLLPENAEELFVAKGGEYTPCGDFVSLCGEPQALRLRESISQIFREYLPR
ncbi:MAG: DNA repair protein RecO [bacterium]|nr:DNA repair protein RecO [bacterium]